MNRAVSVAFLALVSLTACTDQDNQTDEQALASRMVELSVHVTDGEVRARLARHDEIVENQSVNCLRVRPGTTISVNGIAGSLDEVGGFYWSDNGCTSPSLSVPLDGAPTIIDVRIDDGSATLSAMLVKNADGEYVVTSCSAFECS